MSRLRRPLALLVGVLALGALLLGSWSAAQFRSATHGRPWFAAPTQLAVGGEGTLYVALGERELQAYAADGTPRGAWYVERPGAFRLRSAGEGLELVYPDDRVESFDPDGRPGAPRREPGAWERLAAPHVEDAGPGGTRLALRPEGLVRLDDAGPRVLVPAAPAPLAWFGRRPLLPITLVLLGALGGLVACVALARGAKAA